MIINEKETVEILEFLGLIEENFHVHLINTSHKKASQKFRLKNR